VVMPRLLAFDLAVLQVPRAAEIPSGDAAGLEPRLGAAANKTRAQRSGRCPLMSAG